MSIITFIIVLLIIVLVHEFGHFIAAKRSGVRVDEFGFGFPPRLFGKKFGETLYSINLFPIGGFVRIFGETPDEKHLSGPDAKRSLVNKPKWNQAIILGAGVVMNFFLAWFLLVSVFIVGAPYSVNGDIPEGGYVKDPTLTIVQAPKGDPAHRAGLRPGDKIVWIRSENDDLVTEPTNVDVQQFVANNPQSPITIAYKRGSQVIDAVEVVPEFSERLGRPAIGIVMDTVGTLYLPSLGREIVEGTKYTFSISGDIVVGIVGFFKGVLTRDAGFDEVDGPIGLVEITKVASESGFVSLSILVAIISLNLMVINLLPFPALDGGRILFLGIEAIQKKKIKPQVANTVNSIGFFLLLLLMAIITYHDIIEMF